ncbi:MAG TPA: tyrosine--tRNA ligase [Oscillatoriaceae cyanobacterium]
MSAVSAESLETLLLGAAEVLPTGGLEARLKEAAGRPLRIKLGFDPTKPDLHIGHAVVLWALRRFQDAGHQIVLIIGDFTARIGDPTGKQEARPPLSKEEVEANAQTYLDQLGQIIDLDKAEIHRNGEWLDTMNLTDAIRLMGQATVAQMLARENFALRYERGDAIGLHEFLYPLLQGYDSVAIKADVELGGTDQKFNNLMGRQLQENAGQKPQVVMLYPILEGVGTAEKMSKSLGNYIGLTDAPKDMFGKSMRITDEQMPMYYTLASGLPVSEIKQAIAGLQAGTLHPRDAKLNLGTAITKLYHGEEAAREARDAFVSQFSARELPTDIPEMQAASGTPLARLLVDLKLASSVSEARRLIEQGGVKRHGDSAETLVEPNAPIELPAEGVILQVGKRRYARVRPQG